jgi:hypothetical protein
MRSEHRLNEVCGIPGLKFETRGTQHFLVNEGGNAGPSTSIAAATFAQDDSALGSVSQ